MKFRITRLLSLMLRTVRYCPNVIMTLYYYLFRRIWCNNCCFAWFTILFWLRWSSESHVYYLWCYAQWDIARTWSWHCTITSFVAYDAITVVLLDLPSYFDWDEVPNHTFTISDVTHSEILPERDHDMAKKFFSFQPKSFLSR